MPDNGNNGEDLQEEPSEAGAGDLWEDSTQPDIQLLLDTGYEQLDEFSGWLETQLGLDIRTIHRDTFNVEALVDFLANRYVKSPAEANEFELRWFCFSHYIRMSMADVETATQLPDSLQRFYGYLQSVEAFDPPAWLTAVLSDRSYYLARRAAYLDLEQLGEEEWAEGFAAWRIDLEDDLSARCLLPPNDLGAGERWSEKMGWREATLRGEAERRWQVERQELVDEGWDFSRIQQQLVESYELWLGAPDERLEDMTPREVILAERADDPVDPEDDGSE
jgi:hypothetical protein